MKNLSLIFLLFITIQLFAQNPEDWTWYEPDVDGIYSKNIKFDGNGDLWMATRTKLVKFDGINWVIYDIIDFGYTGQVIKNFVFEGTNKIWLGTNKLVLEFEIDSNSWVAHDPTNGQTNLNTYNIGIDSDDNVWWAISGGLYRYDGQEWTHYNLWNGSMTQMNENKLATIRVDSQNQKWMTTVPSVCIDIPCITPSGVVMLSETDTAYFQAPDLGVPEAFTTKLDLKSNENPVLVANDIGGENSYLLEFVNGVWTAPILIPFSGQIYDMKINNADEIYIAYEDFVLKGGGTDWEVITVDTNHITKIKSILIDADNGLYVFGEYGTDFDAPGVVGYLPELKFRIDGLVYIDENVDGIFNPDETRLSNQFVRTLNTNQLTFSNNIGAYNLPFLEAGDYDLELILPPYFFYGNPDNGQQSVSISDMEPSVDSVDFGLEPDVSAYDLAISITSINNANPGFEIAYLISVKNKAPNLTSATLTFNFDNLLTFLDTDYAAYSINGNEITYDLTDIGWLEEVNIRAYFSIPPDPDLIGQFISLDAEIVVSNGTDLDLSNNTYHLDDLITGPYDPNYIAVYPKGQGPQGLIFIDTTTLEYTIHFQNVGNDTARNVVISNPLDVDLNILTLEVVGSSHDYSLDYFMSERVLRWTFEDINLVDSLTNYIASNGFIKYKISVLNPVPDQIITNTADIYFDYNLPIETNTTTNTLLEIPISTYTPNENPECDFSILVLSDMIRLNRTLEDATTVKIFDLTGKFVTQSSFTGKTTDVNIKNLQNGLYNIQLLSKNCNQPLAKQFLINRQ